MRQLKIIGVNIFLEKRKTRSPVGVLKHTHDGFIFTYDEQYFRAKHVIPLGPEFPLTQKQFTSKKLFPSFEDRIPSRQNPAYEEYCHSTGIDISENDPIILLSFIGKKGPSSFIFHPIFDTAVHLKEIIEFRQFLNLTTREFAKIFEFSQTSLNAFERNRSTGKDILKRLEIILRFPVVASYFLQINGGILIYEKWAYATSQLKHL